MNPHSYLTLAERWQDLTSLSYSAADGVGVLGMVMMLEVLSEWLLSWTGLSGDVFEYQAQLADLMPLEVIKVVLFTCLMVFVPLLLRWLLLLLYLLLQSLFWPRLTAIKPDFSSPSAQDCLLGHAHGCRAPPLAHLGC